MPLKYFNCPDNETRPVAQCLQSCPRAEGRCLSLPTLYEIGRDRVFKGRPSTTQLLNPTRLAYLLIKHDYAIEPESRAFALLGTRHHQTLEHTAKTLSHLGLKTEQFLDSDGVTGIADLIEPDELNPTQWKVIDYKTWGAYAVAKMLSNEGNNNYEKWQAGYQLNNYRLKIEATGLKVSRLIIQATVRDGGTRMAIGYGIERKIYQIPIPILPDERVKQFFEQRRSDLLYYVDRNELPPMCSYPDRWEGRRCKGYCDVFMFCPEGAKINKVELLTQEAHHD